MVGEGGEGGESGGGLEDFMMDFKGLELVCCSTIIGGE